MTSPGAYLAIDPGRKMGYAHCLRGGGDLRHGTWKYKQDLAGECYALFLGNLRQKILALPDVQIGMELHFERDRLPFLLSEQNEVIAVK